MADPHLEIKGGGGGGGGSPKIFFGPFGPQFGVEIRGGGGAGPRAPPLNPPLLTTLAQINSLGR